METKFERQLKKGVLEMVVLGLACEQPVYGYELLRELRQRSGGLFTLKEGTLYPILYRLEDEGLIEAQWHTEGNRAAPKKYYTATDAGRSALATQRGIWRRFAACVAGFTEEDAK